MSTTEASTLTYDVFVNDPPPQNGVLPNGEPKVLPHGQHVDLRQRGRGPHGPGADGEAGARARRLGRLDAGLTDFGPGREELFGRSEDGYLKVHDRGETEADGKNFKGRALGVVLSLFGLKAIEARNGATTVSAPRS